VLTAPEPRRRSAQRSLKQEYADFILQRIEEFKQQITRQELLAIADDAVHELEAGAADQLVLTEVLMLEHVDRLIRQRLNLPSYRRWRDRHLRLRRAQQQPTHWDLAADGALARLARGGGDGPALVLGTGATNAALYLAAHDWDVTFVDADLATVDALETRAATESLGSRMQTLVVHFGLWQPEVYPMLSVLDPVTLNRMDGAVRRGLFEWLIGATPGGGAHVILPAPGPDGVLAIAPEALRTMYRGWTVSRGRTGGREVVATKP
jgi:hypothetical protein